ncbi:MAG: NADPH-dependent F420 reductase [Acidimicrobiia bacterium]
MTAMDIAVVGAGPVGTNLATRFAELGHRVTFGARDPHSDKVRAALQRVHGARAEHLSAVPDGADMAVLAVPFAAVGDAIGSMGDLDEVVLVDATNPIGVALPAGCASVVDVIRRQAPGAVVVKAFNTIGAEAFLDPTVDGVGLFLPVAGPEPAASRVAALGAALGFDAVVVGGEDQAHHLEAMAALWIHLAFRVGLGRHFGFARLSTERPA